MKDLNLTKESHQDVMVALLINLWGDWDDVKDFAGQYTEWDGSNPKNDRDYYVKYFMVMVEFKLKDLIGLIGKELE